MALAKTCRIHGIPIPPRGYWAKLQAGKKVSRPPLPARGLGMPEIIRAGGRYRSYYYYYYEAPADLIGMEIPPPPEFPEPVSEVAERVRKLVGSVAVQRDLSKAHQAVARLLEDDAARRQKYLASTYRSFWDAPLFDSPFERRRLRLVNAIFIALERCGMRPSLRGNDPAEFYVRVGEELVTFTLDHPKQRRDGYRPESEMDRPASDKLILSISAHERPEDLRFIWEDNADGTIEKHVGEIVVALIVAGEVQYRQGELSRHKWLIERKARLIEEARRRKEEEERKERERRIAEEKMRVDRLLAEAAAFRQASDIRAYVDLVREASRTSPDLAGREELEAWASWALAHADRIDPVRSKRFLATEPEAS